MAWVIQTLDPPVDYDVPRKMSPATLGEGLGAWGEHRTRQLSIKERAFEEVQKSSREVPATQ